MRTLFLTSPHMRGEDVKTLQRALNRNRFADFLKGSAVDGEFGLYTSQAVYRAKYWLGYAKPSHSASARLVGYLKGDTLSLVMRKRRKARLALKAERPIRLKALEKMKGFVGIHGLPNEITRWYGWSASWCAMAVSKAYCDAGSAAFKRGSRFASCGVMADNARLGNYGLSLTKNPQPGDLVFFNWPGTAYLQDHVEMVVTSLPLTTIGGNTSPDAAGSQSNGGVCCKKDRESERRAGLVRSYLHVSK